MATKHSAVTVREAEILRLIGEGKASKEIATELHLSIHTVCNHRKHLCHKLDIHTAAELIAYAAKSNSPPPSIND
jgi:DNA-binding CsgD family transcriptional regulator